LILLDTNVVSETMRPQPDARLVRWLDSQLVETLHLSAVSLAELLLGIAVLPDGRRKAGLAEALTHQTRLLFEGRILPFDAAAAASYGALVARARAAGTAVGMADAQIAAIADSRGLAVASRDTGPFVATDVPVVDPWAEA